MDESEYQLEIKKLNRELRRVKKDNELLRIANDQVSRTQAYIQKDITQQIFYINQLLKSSPYLLILTNHQLQTVMTSDMFFRYETRYDEDEIKRGIPLSLALANILPGDLMHDLLSNCYQVLKGESIEPYLVRTYIAGQKYDIQISIMLMKQKNEVFGLNILFVNMTRMVEAIEQSQQADRAKSNFLANMSHEIRTPMNAIVGMSEFILRDSDDPKAKTHASMIRSSAKTLLSIINDILDFSKIESGKMEIRKSHFKLSNVIIDVGTLMKIKVLEKPIQLILELDSTIPEDQYGDEVRIKQILINLISNAIKFTNNGSITVKIWKDSIAGDDYNYILGCSITDTGIGIKKEELSKIFENFIQVDTKRNRKVQGTGLGLAISKHLANMMGGDVTVESEYGKGSTFTVYVTTHSDNKTPVGVITTIPTSNLNLEIFKATFTARKAKILVVDDSEINLKVSCGVLVPYKAQIECATCGAEALLKFAKTRYDLIFMDHMMPVMDGVEAANMIRKMPFGDVTPIVALTANALSGADSEYKRLGFQDFLSKPIELYDLEQVLRRNLNPSLIDAPDPEEHDEMLKVNETGSDAAPQESPAAVLTSRLIDINVGLRYCMGNTDFYKKMLDIFASSSHMKEINELFSSGDWKNYQIKVHALKGVALTVGAKALSDIAKEIEQAVKVGNVEVAISHNSELNDVYEDTIALINSGDLAISSE